MRLGSLRGGYGTARQNDAEIAANPNPTDQWFQTGLDAGTTVHVVGNRAGLTAGAYSSSGTQDTLANLSQVSTGVAGQTWGDLQLLRVYAEIGSWPNPGTFDSFVDDINIESTPEPGSIALLGGGLLSVAAMARRKRRAA